MKNVTTVLVDVGGTNTRIETQGLRVSFPTNLPKLPQQINSFIRRLPGTPLGRGRRGQARPRGVPGRRPGKKGAAPKLLIVGMRGVWAAKERTAWKKKFMGLAQRVDVMSDIELAHWKAFGEKPGVILNAGTGSIALGRGKNGKIARAGGLGPLLGDEGSAFWIGKEYLKRFKDQTETRAWAVKPQAVSKIAGIAKKVLKGAPRNKEMAALVKKAQGHLHDLVVQVKKKLNLQNKTPVVLTGGLFEDDYFFKKFLSRRPGMSLSRAQVVFYRK